MQLVNSVKDVEGLGGIIGYGPRWGKVVLLCPAAGESYEAVHCVGIPCPLGNGLIIRAESRRGMNSPPGGV